MDLSNLIAFADDKLYRTYSMKYAHHRIENIVGKGENAGNQHFLLFPQYFAKAYFQGREKFGLCGKELSSRRYTEKSHSWNK